MVLKTRLNEYKNCACINNPGFEEVAAAQFSRKPYEANIGVVLGIVKIFVVKVNASPYTADLVINNL